MLLSFRFPLLLSVVLARVIALCAVAALLTVLSVRPVLAQTLGKREWLETEATASAAGKRVALVVGNTHYGGRNGLANPENDARAMAHTLQALGFEVLMCLDQTNRQMADDVSEFGTRINGASVALFYFSGHGSQVEGINYLIPVGFEGHSANDIKYDALNVGRVLDTLSEAKSHVNIVILDACRDNPFAPQTRSLTTRGLAPVDAPGGTLIAYATAPGKTAEDNPNGANGLFTQELLRQMRVPGIPVEDVFKNTRRSVREASAGKQVPWEESSLEDQFYFAVGKTPVPPPPIPHDEPFVGEVKINPKDGAEMVWIPAGPFLMGDSDTKDNPRHTVTLSGYYIYKNLVTVAMYRKFCVANGRQMPSPPGWGWQEAHPIVKVSWDDAKAYCDWAGVKLPTEAQWEKAARGTDGREYPWGNEFDNSRLWCSTTKSRSLPAPVGSFPSGASPYGVLDMVGNVAQWCADWYAEDYMTSSPSRDPQGPPFAESRVLRGSIFSRTKTLFSRSSHREKIYQAHWSIWDGFRCASN